ncbi:putative ribonuclease H-like domain-containing protein [Tanacetum coccineum]|uniref:Ribonuclease H-like domain-containing protein n=1 Tax=Tanacetum coccineum TaxID=301880 RepID=A0ABQ4YIR2_9ASTR
MKTFILVYLPVPILGRAQEGNPGIKRSKLDRSYARRASAIQITTSLDIAGFTLWQEGHWNKIEEGIDYDEVFAPVARIEAIRLFLAYALFKDFVVYQMDVKSAFMYGKIEKEVYVCQPPGFEYPEFPNKVYKVEKALYGLHQAHRAWYRTLSTYLLDNGFQREIPNEFYGELTFFLGLQVTQKDDGIFISQDKYVDEILKKFGFSTVKTTTSRPNIIFAVCACARFQVTPKVSHLHAVKKIFRYLKGQPKLGLWYPKDSLFDLEAYTDSDNAGASLDKKSTTMGF